MTLASGRLPLPCSCIFINKNAYFLYGSGVIN
jgi:hypothetical protein